MSVLVNCSIYATLITSSITDYSKLPATPPVDTVFLLDPLIATGGTARAALAMIEDWGVPGELTLIPRALPNTDSRDSQECEIALCFSFERGPRTHTGGVS